MIDVLIAGGGTAGLTAALYARRAGKTALILETETFGGQIASSPKVENYPGIPSVSGAAFADALLTQAMDAGADVELERATAFAETPGGFAVTAGKEQYIAKTVILATGVKRRKLGVPGEEELAGRGVSYCAVCDGAFYKGKPVAVIGGGSSALTSALFLSATSEKVYLVHRRAEFRGEEALAETLKARPNVEFVLNSRIAAFEGADRLERVRLDGKGALEISAAFVCVGQVPDSAPVRGFVALDEAGYIVAGEDTLTSRPGVFAAGDCRTKSVRQLATAAADGAVAALAACALIDARAR